jgi:rod shape determining protein RodA
MFSRAIKNIDWLLVLFLLPIVAAGLVTMTSFSGDTPFFARQIMWVIISFSVFFVFSSVDFRFLRHSNALIISYAILLLLLVALFIFGATVKGATSWFDFGGFSLQPVDFMKIALIGVLAKYFSRRHIEIKNIRHLLISAMYGLVPFLLVLLQPDFGSAIIILAIWFGMTLVSGISKKHILIVFGIGLLAFLLLWGFVFADYQKNRIRTFIDPLADRQGAGYNAYQSTVAVGSGQFFGKGLGYGTQSRLSFLPESETDFIFAAFAEEWGFVGAILVLLLYGLVVARLLRIAIRGETNFETLFALGLAIMIISHVLINVGMNIALLPVTGITLPFMSYGGSHLLTTFIGLGVLMGMRSYERSVHKDDMNYEFLGLE